MARTLGIHSGHDGGAAICVDGSIVVAAAEERIVRKKYANGWWHAVKYCLEHAGLQLSAFDLIVFSNAGAPLPAGYDGGLSRWGSPLPRVETVDHHLSHAVGAYAFASPKRLLVLVSDAGGNSGRTESIFVIDESEHHLISTSDPVRPRHAGLGTTYEAFTNFLGFADQESGKTMALAGYGDKTAWQETSLFEVSKEGRITGALPATHQWGVTEFAHRRGLPWGSPFPSSEGQLARNIAAYVQAQLTATLDAVLQTFARQTGIRDVSISGGVGLNCVAISTLKRMAGGYAVHPFAASSDTGLAIGNALFGQWRLDGRFPKHSGSELYLGRSYSEEDILEAVHRAPHTVPPGPLRSGDLKFTRSIDPARDAAQLLSQGAIIGWWQGRSETGPRALGARSILADPAREDVRNALNEKVKRREWFRPFGPSMLAEDAAMYLGEPGPFPFMAEAPRTTIVGAQAFPACVHIDGSARAQTVDRHAGTRFAKLLQNFRDTSGHGVLLNTSFNIQEPIVETPGDAVATFLRSTLDALVLDEFVCTRIAPFSEYAEAARAVWK